MKSLSVLLCLTFLSACSTVKKTSQPVEVVIPTPSVVVQTDIGSNAAYAQIQAIAGTSGISKYIFKQRGKAPLGFIKGVALAYAQELCNPSLAPTGTSETDALVYYNLQGETSVLTYAFLIGLGMRESSGRYCEGRDMSASNVASISAEAGMFQTSYDAGTATKLLPEFNKACLLEIFKEGVNQSKCNPKNYGTGVGFEFQKKSKECPAFAVKVAADTIRKKRKHYGPINRKEVEFRPEAVELLAEVKKIVEANPSVCSVL